MPIHFKIPQLILLVIPLLLICIWMMLVKEYSSQQELGQQTTMRCQAERDYIVDLLLTVHTIV